MKAQHIITALFCLAVVFFSCKRESTSLMINRGLAVTQDTPVISLQQTYVATSTAGGAGIGYFSADFNGDGYSDVIQPWGNNGNLAIRVFDVSGTGTFLLCDQTDSLDNTSITNKGMLAGDYDGDGKADLIQCWNNNEHMGIRVFKSTGTSFVKTYEGTMVESPYNLGLLAVDIDADGKTDIAQTYTNNGHFTIKIYHSTGTGFEEYANVRQTGGNLSEGIFAADWDGDGKTEIVQTWNNGGKLGYFVYHSTDGRRYTTAYSDTSEEASSNSPLIPLDYNGDGKDDFLQTWNNNGNIDVILYQSDGSSYSEIGNFATVPGKTYLGWLRAKRPGQRDGLLKVWNNRPMIAFYRFDFIY